MKKKILSVVLALTMAMGMSISAFADTVVGNQEGAAATAAAGCGWSAPAGRPARPSISALPFRFLLYR